MPILTISSVQPQSYINVLCQYLKTGPLQIVGKIVPRFLIANNPTLIDGNASSIFTISVNEPISLNFFSSAVFPATFNVTLFDEAGNPIKTQTPNILNQSIATMTPSKLYYLYFQTTVGGGSPGDVIFNALQTPIVESFFPGGFTKCVLNNTITSYDNYSQPTFTFGSFSLVKGENYIVSYAYEATKSGVYDVIISDSAIATAPESVPFTRGLSTFYSFQSLVTGKFNFIIKFNIRTVGTPIYVDLMPTFHIDKEAVSTQKAYACSEPIPIPAHDFEFPQINDVDDDDSFINYRRRNDRR